MPVLKADLVVRTLPASATVLKPGLTQQKIVFLAHAQPPVTQGEVLGRHKVPAALQSSPEF
jgi:hypothetical protein